MARRSAAGIALFLSMAGNLFAGSAPTIILGVLEENKGHYYGEPNYRDVRAVFQKKDGEWQALPSNCPDQDCLKTRSKSYPKEVKWTISFDGRNVGQVTSRTPAEFKWYSDVGQQEITSKGGVPEIGKPSSEFGGFTEADVHRPLVANSQPYYSDPDLWKPIAATPELTQTLRRAFRLKFPKLCRISRADESKVEAFPYRDQDVLVVKSYASRPGWVVAQLHLEAIHCEDTEAGFEIDDAWFVVDLDKSAKYLESGIWLVDAGDYDNDGKSELVFSIARENEGGYVIFYDDFRKHTTFKFNYH